MKENSKEMLFMLSASTLSAVLLSLPWLVPHCGAFALVGFVPLLLADALADRTGVRRFFPYYFYCFVLWNTLTTFWVCNATVGGGIFAIVANAAQMALVWMVYRLSKRRLGGAVPYIFLAAAWIAWESRYFEVDISWPWLVLGNAFASSTKSIQWYEFTGALGGSLWVWLCNLGIFGLVYSVLTGRILSFNRVARTCAFAGVVVVVAAPLLLSKAIYERRGAEADAPRIDVVIAQPNLDPYEKFESLTQDEQNARLLSLFDRSAAMKADSARVLLLAPETFTSDVYVRVVYDEVKKTFLSSKTLDKFRTYLSQHPGAEMLLGASVDERHYKRSAPTPCARESGDFWTVSRNSAILLDTLPQLQIYHKSKLVVGVEMTPYPKIFVPVDEFLSRLFGVYGLMGRCEGQDKTSCLTFGASGSDPVKLGCAVCYESVYGDFCRGYVKDGAQAMTVITNDAWWGDTPGYRQHLNYSRLRAIELRRDIARCGNTGISCFIDSRGDIVSSTAWWEQAVLEGSIALSDERTFFVRNGDLAGRISCFVFVLLALLVVVRYVVPKR